MGSLQLILFPWLSLALTIPTHKCQKLYKQFNDSREVGITEHWGVDFRGSLGGDDRYENTFEEALKPFHNFDELARARKKLGKHTHTLDIAGSAVFSEHPFLYDSLTGFRLGPSFHNPKHLFGALNYNAWREIYGNIFNPKFLIPLKDRKYDLIIVRPVAGVLDFEEATKRAGASSEEMWRIELKALDRIWNLASDDEGMIFLNIRIFTKNEFIHEWVKRCRSVGVDARLYRSFEDGLIIRLTKTPESRKHLSL